MFCHIQPAFEVKSDKLEVQVWNHFLHQFEMVITGWWICWIHAYMLVCFFFVFFLMCSSFLLRFKYSPAVFVGEQDGPHLLLCLLCLFLPSRSAVRLAFFASEENAQGSQCLPSGQTYFWKKDPVCFNASSDAVWRCPPEPLHDVCLLKKKKKKKKKKRKKVHEARTEAPLFACLGVFHSVCTEVGVWHSREIALHITSPSF